MYVVIVLRKTIHHKQLVTVKLKVCCDCVKKNYTPQTISNSKVKGMLWLC